MAKMKGNQTTISIAAQELNQRQAQPPVINSSTLAITLK
jgi:hypothetical protein